MFEPTQRYAVVLSDVHIGNGAPTCWYQSPVHERQLTEVLNWILARRAVVREVVLLGDLFDVWTYPPHVRPPSMGDIIAANRSLLGPRGPLSAVVRALPARVRLLLGNHDGSLTRADIDTLNRSLGGNQSRGERIELVDAPWRVVTGASGARTVFSHGHRWCMFNAPDTRSRWSTIPIGHVVSRAIAYGLAKTLRPGETAAHRPNSGNPTGINARVLMSRWRRDDLAAFLLDYFCGATGMPKTEPIVMPGGSTTTAEEAARVFAGLYTLWVRREGRERDALRAAAAEYPGGADLAWFAQRLAIRTASDLAVMGHTHTPVGGLEVSPVNYVNSGYMCVSRPDAARGTELTFTQVDLERATAQVLAVVGTAGRFGIAPAKTAHLMPSAILHGARDYSCYVRLENRSDRPLRLVRAGKSSASYWVVGPPARIAPHARVDMWVQDPPLTEGSEGSFTYSDARRTLDFAVKCPRLSSNSVTSPVPGYQTKVGRRAWRTGGVDGSGYPLQVRFFVEALSPAGVGPASRPAAPPVRRRPAAPQESQYVVAARAVLDAHRSPSYRGAVMCVAHLTSNDGGPLLDPETEPSRTRPRGDQLKNPPNHLLGPDIESITVNGIKYDFVWIQPNIPPEAPPNAGGMAFLPAKGAATFTLVTFNVAALLDKRRGCRNDHHAEMQVVGFVNAQNARFKLRLGRLQLHNRSRRGPGWGWSACNRCLGELAAFLKMLNTPSRRGTVTASISWERLYVKGPPGCGHETDAASIQQLVDAGWDQPQGDRPPGTKWPTRAPAPPARRPARPRVYTA
jgi:hypothetical protein